MVEEVSADTDELDRFVERGERYVAALRGVDRQTSLLRARTSLELGWSPPAPAASPTLDLLIDEGVVANAFVAVIGDALRAFDPDLDTPEARVPAIVVDAGLAEAGIVLGPAGRAPGSLGRLADRVDGIELDLDGPTAQAGQAYQRIVADIDRGGDLGMSNGELNRVRDRLAALDPDQAELVLSSLSDEQLDVVFHNAHSSGFWSNDWDDRERTEFYAILDPLSTELKTDLGRFSPYLEAMAEAEGATSGDRPAERALVALRTSDGFSGHLDFEQRTAVLWQAANQPSAEAIGNLDRLSAHGWFADMDLADTQRSAKMIAFLSEHPGDPTVIANTLDRFLAPDAPYRFDWDKDGRAYGSAGGDEFHFNRRYLDGGNDPVLASVPSGRRQRDTEHMVTHTVVHEVNHLVNGDRPSASYEYFMAEYRAYWVGHVAQYGSPPTRAEVRRRVELFFTAGPDHSYHRIAQAVDDPVEGPLIATFATGILGRPVPADELAAEIVVGITDPDVLAPLPVAVGDEIISIDNSPIEGVR